jgi:ABC-type amino acid transport substrate-binding protein
LFTDKLYAADSRLVVKKGSDITPDLSKLKGKRIGVSVIDSEDIIASIFFAFNEGISASSGFSTKVHWDSRLVVKKGSDITPDLSKLKGKRIGVLQGTTQETRFSVIDSEDIIASIFFAFNEGISASSGFSTKVHVWW